MVSGSDDPTLPGDERPADGFASTVAGAGVDARTQGGPASSEPDGPLPRGTKIGAFVVEGPLGTGAMGTVLLARDPELARPVAIKLVAPGRGGEAAHQRLLREAQAAARLSHPNVVAIHQAGTWREQVFIVMEYVDGGTLGTWVKEAPRRWEDVLDAFHQAGEGLLAAHRAGLVHRDFKPENVLIGRDGRVRVSDFGLVGVEGGAFKPDATIDGASIDLTRTGALVGTPAYMAPEQFEGSRVDARADQFSFAVALYEALYGVRPYFGTTVTNLLYSMSSGEIQPPPSSAVPRAIYAALLRALAANPEARYPSMAELLAALRREPSSPAAKHGTSLAIGVGAVVVAVGATTAFFVVRDDDPAGPTEATPPESSAVDCTAQPGLDGVWNEQRRAAILEAFAGLPNPTIGQAAGTKLVAALDRYTNAWREVSTAACQAAHVDGTRSAEELALQTTCLEDRRTELEVFLGVLAEEDTGVLPGGLGAAARLAPISACSDLGALRSVPASPQEGQRREAVTQVRRERAHAAILLGAGRYPDALEAARAASVHAEATSYEPEIVRAKSIAAEANLQLTRVAEAEEVARDLVERAASIREHDVEAHAWQMILMIAYSQGRLSDAMTIYDSAKVAATRSGNPYLQAKLLNHAANLAYLVSHATQIPAEQTEKLEVARVRANEAVAAFKALPDPTVGLGNAYVLRAAVETSLENTEAAREDYGRARRIFAETVGEDHVVAVVVLVGEAGLAFGKQDYAEAAKLYRQAADLYLEVDPHHVAALSPLTYLAESHQKLGDGLKAEAALEEAVRVGTLEDGSMRAGLLDVLQRLGQIAWLAGRWEAAELRYGKAKVVAQTFYGERSLELARCQVQLAIVAQSQGDFEGSVPYAEAAVETTLRAAGPTNPSSREFVAFLADTYAHLDRCTDAFPRLAQADAIAARNALPEDLVSVQTRIARAVCKLHAGDLEATQRELDEAALVLPTVPYPGPMAPYLASVRARLQLEQGKPDEARASAQTASDGFVALGTPYAVFAEEMRELIRQTEE